MHVELCILHADSITGILKKNTHHKTRRILVLITCCLQLISVAIGSIVLAVSPASLNIPLIGWLLIGSGITALVLCTFVYVWLTPKPGTPFPPDSFKG